MSYLNTSPDKEKIAKVNDFKYYDQKVNTEPYSYTKQITNTTFNTTSAKNNNNSNNNNKHQVITSQRGNQKINYPMAQDTHYLNDLVILELNNNDEVASKEQSNIEAQNEIDLINKQSIQKGFIKKVLMILMCMLSLTVIWVVIVMQSLQVKKFVKKYYFLYWLAIASYIVFSCIIYFYKRICRRVPYNYICLFCLTISTAYIFGLICVMVSALSVVIAAVAVFISVVSIFIHSFLAKNNITKKMGVLLFLPGAVIFLVLFCIFFSDRAVQAVIGILFALFFMLFLIYDLQRLQKKLDNSYSIDDYIIATLDLYIDIIMIFYLILCATSRQ